MIHKVILSIGSNIGNKKENIVSSFKLIEDNLGKIIKKSSYFYSKSWGYVSENDFVNSCILIETKLSPFDLLLLINDIEIKMGRLKNYKKEYQDRIIDIDIIYYDELIVNDLNLKIPHTLMYKRNFVLIPLKEIYSEFIDPIKKIKVSDL